MIKEIETNKNNLMIKNTLVTLNKNFRPFEAKIYYGLLSKFTYEYRVNNVYERKISMSVNEVKKLMNKNTDISFNKLIEKVESMETWLKLKHNNETKTFESMVIITRIFIENNIITFTLNQDICEMAKEQTNQFAIIKLMEIANLSSSFSLKAYEICCVYKNLKSGFYNMTREYFLEYFNIPKSYRSSDIDNRVLRQSMQEINTKTRFTLKISKVKENNKITHYRFYIKENEIEELKKEIEENFIDCDYSIKENKEVENNQENSTSNVERINTDEIISYNEFFEKVWKTILNDYRTKGSRMREGKGQVKTTQRKKLMKVGEEVLNKALDLYLSKNTDKKFYLKGSTWFNSGYEDYLEKAVENLSFKKEDKKNEEPEKSIFEMISEQMANK